MSTNPWLERLQSLDIKTDETKSVGKPRQPESPASGEAYPNSQDNVAPQVESQIAQPTAQPTATILEQSDAGEQSAAGEQPATRSTVDSQNPRATGTQLSFGASRKGSPGRSTRTIAAAQIPQGGGSALAGASHGEPISSAAILQQLEKLSPDDFLLFDKSQKKNFYLFGAAVLIVIIAAIISTATGMTEISKWSTRACFIAVPVSIFYGVSEAIKRLLKHSPAKAQKLFSVTSWGDAREMAISYINNADYLTAEKILEKACKSTSAKNASGYLAAYGLLGLVHAYTGRTDQAEKIVKQTLDVCEANFASRATESNSKLLALVLSYRAEISQLESDYTASLNQYLRSLQLTCSQTNPHRETLITSLINVGHLQSTLGKYGEAVLVLRKAKTLADSSPQSSATTTASLLSNLGTSYRGIGDLDDSEKCFEEAMTSLANAGKRESGRVLYDLAKLHATHAQHDSAKEFYDKAVAVYDSWTPVASPEFLKVLKEYAYYLRATDRVEEAELVKKRAAQMQQVLQDINRLHQGEAKKIRTQVVQGVAKNIKAPRFPVFWTIVFLWQCFSVYDGGIRASSSGSWMWLIGSAAVLSIKLRNKYGPPSNLELSKGASVALTVIPFARSILPELGQLTKKELAIFVGLFVCLFAGVKMTLVPPDTVPDNLLNLEYHRLGYKYAAEEKFNLAKKALDKIIERDNGTAAEEAKQVERTRLPKTEQPEAAIQANLHAQEISLKNPEGALQEWRSCSEAYPTFEAPIIHIAESYVRGKERKAKAEEAEKLLTPILTENPDYVDALLAMGQVKNAEGDFTNGLEYTRKALDIIGGKNNPLTQMNNDMLNKVKDMKAKRDKLKAEHAATESSK